MNDSTYESQLAVFIAANTVGRPEFSTYYRYPCLNDDTINTNFDTHYTYHVAWAIRKILVSPPVSHCDVSSSLGFCTAICAVVPTTFIDYRPAPIQLDQLTCKQGDLTNDSQWGDGQYESLSCMHVVEHIGMGRYGDQLDIHADTVAMRNLKRAVAANGRLLFVVPVGIPEVYFNAHRVYSASWVANFFKPEFQLKEFYFIPGSSHLPPVLNCDLTYPDSFKYACGCFEFIKCESLV